MLLLLLLLLDAMLIELLYGVSLSFKL